VLALSGFIPTVEGFELEWSNLRGMAVAVGHGTQDPVIPVEFGRDARQGLEQAGARVVYRESPIVHAIDPLFVRVLQGWLSKVV
jgi:phospholipase/carboxylesterase